MMDTLTVVRAGAGSGKTFDLCETLVDEISRGLDPASILATTFTRKAAAELKGRIQTRLLACAGMPLQERIAKSERLDMAFIGTVHSVGHQLLSRYALHLGLSPRLEVLEEGGSDRCLQRLLAERDSDSWRELTRLAQAVSHNEVQSTVLGLLAAKRGNNISDADFRTQMQASGGRLCEVLGVPEQPGRAVDFDQLYGLAKDALDQLDRIEDTTKDTQAAQATLRQMTTQRDRTWRDFADAAKIKAGKRSGADKCLDKLRAAGATVRRNPALHEAVRRFTQALAEETLALQSDYERYKAERGMVDFTDLEVKLLQLLDTPAARESLQQEFRVVVVDEFQDTNPLQLALFERFRDLAERSRWVGDAKQSIYAFRGTDPELVRQVWDAVPDNARKTLPKNYRSQAGLVQLVGRLFSPVLGVEAKLEPVHPGKPCGIERWLLQTSSQPKDAMALAAGIAELHDEGIPYRDIAVLVRTNSEGEGIGDALSAIGIPSLVALPGLLATRECALAVAGLRLVADQGDSLAAATVQHILDSPGACTPTWLRRRLVSCRTATARHAAEGENRDATADRSAEQDGIVGVLGGIGSRTLPPSAVFDQVVYTLGIGGRLRAWGDAARRAAHLDALGTLAQAYEEEARDLGLAPTLSGLIVHIEGLAAEGKDIRAPASGLDAVTIHTYHGSKGLEWPVVVLSGLGFQRDPDMWNPVVSGGNRGGGDPLKGRELRYWPWPFGHTEYRGIVKRVQDKGLEDTALQTPEGEAARSRAQAEEMRLLYVGCTRARDKLVLAHRPDGCTWLNQLPDVNTVLPPGLETGTHPLQGVDTTYVIRHLTTDMAEQHRRAPAAQEAWLAEPEATGPAKGAAPRYRSPSGAEPVKPAPAVSIEELCERVRVPHVDEGDQAAALGNAVHAFLAALPSLADAAPSVREAVAARCLAAYGAEGLVPAAALVERGECFRKWAEDRYPGARWLAESPVTSPHSDGSQWNGAVDLVLVLPGGEVVVVDHKSTPIRTGECKAKAATYTGQIRAYHDAVSSQGLRVKDAWIHFPLAGVMAKIG